MKVYLYSYCIVSFVLSLVNSVTFIPTIKALSEENYLIGTAFFALVGYFGSHIFAKKRIIDFVFNNYTFFLFAELFSFVIVSFYVYFNDASDIALIIRWVYLGTLGDLLMSCMIIIWEKYKEYQGDGSAIQMKTEHYRELGTALGTCTAVGLLIFFNIMIPIHIGFLLQGIFCILENIALYYLIKTIK